MRTKPKRNIGAKLKQQEEALARNESKSGGGKKAEYSTVDPAAALKQLEDDKDARLREMGYNPFYKMREGITVVEPLYGEKPRRKEDKPDSTGKMMYKYAFPVNVTKAPGKALPAKNPVDLSASQNSTLTRILLGAWAGNQPKRLPLLRSGLKTDTTYKIVEE